MDPKLLTDGFNTFIANGPYALAAYWLLKWVLNRADADRISYQEERKETTKVLQGIEAVLNKLAGQVEAVARIQEGIISKLDHKES